MLVRSEKSPFSFLIKPTHFIDYRTFPTPRKKTPYAKILRHSSFRGAPGLFILIVLFAFSFFLNHFKTTWGKLIRRNFGSLRFRTLKFGFSEIPRTCTCISLLGSPIPFSYGTKVNRGENPK